MTHPEPNITVKVDVTNPGQFFACCGLLELADRLWPGAEGWFESGCFYLVCDGEARSVNDLISELLQCPELEPGVTKKSVLGDSKLKLTPLALTFRNGVLRVDWWRDEMSPPSKDSREDCAKSDFKTWAGNQSPQQIIYDKLLPALRKIIDSDTADWFHARVPLSGRFGFDHTSAVTAIDVGWSPDKQNITVSTSPAVELLGMIGLQRCRPAATGKRRLFVYHAWSVRASAIAAPAMVAGAIAGSGGGPLLFSIEERGDYGYFSPATPLESRHERHAEAV